MDKRGFDLAFSTVIFLVLNLAFFSILAVFIVNSATGAIFYEQVYAKQVALVFDSAKPGMEVEFDVSKGFELVEKNKVDKNFIKINDETNSITVSLRPGKGYSATYFSDLNFEYELKDNNMKLRFLE